MVHTTAIFQLNESKSLMNRLYRLPVIEPDGQVVYMRSRGVPSGLFHLVQAAEDMATQWCTLRAEVEFFARQGEWCLESFGTLADDSTEGGGWNDLSAYFDTRRFASDLAGLELDFDKSHFGTRDKFHCLGYERWSVLQMSPSNEDASGTQ